MVVGIQATAGGAFDISPDGNTVAYSGGNHVIYLLDAKTLTVKKRIRLEKNPSTSFDGIYSFSPDGKTFLYTSSWDILVYNTENWTLKRKLKKDGDIYLSDDHTKFVLYDDKKITIYDVNTATITKTIMTEIENRDVQNVSFSIDNSKLIVISDENDSKTEKKQSFSYKDFDGLSEKEEVEKRLKNDGKDLNYSIIDIATAKVERSKTIWFSDYNIEVVALPDNGFILGCGDGLIKIDAADQITVYNVEGGNNFHYDATNKLVIYTTSFCGLNVFNFEFNNEFELKNKYVSFTDDCLVHNGKYYVIFNEYCIATCTKEGNIVSPMPIY